jgi:hypothetical protein
MHDLYDQVFALASNMIYHGFRCWLLDGCTVCCPLRHECRACWEYLRIVHVCCQQTIESVLNSFEALAEFVVQDACDAKVMRA